MESDNSEMKSQILKIIQETPYWNLQDIQFFISRVRSKYSLQQLNDFIMESISKKNIHFVRHAESKYNKWAAESIFHFSVFYKNTEENRDPCLTDLGISQCRDSKKATDINPEIIYVSPLTRACETAIEIFGNGKNMKATELIREMIDTACDLGIPKSELVKKFPDIDFSDVKGEYWWGFTDGTPDPYIENFKKETLTSVENRIFIFLLYLSCHDHKDVAIVSHSLLYRVLFSKYPKFCKPPKNAGIMKLESSDISKFLKRVLKI